MYLAGSFNSLAEGSRGRLSVEGVSYEQVLGGVHYERTTTDIAADAQERQVAYTALHYRGCLLENE